MARQEYCEVLGLARLVLNFGVTGARRLGATEMKRRELLIQSWDWREKHAGTDLRTRSLALSTGFPLHFLTYEAGSDRQALPQG